MNFAFDEGNCIARLSRSDRTRDRDRAGRRVHQGNARGAGVRDSKRALQALWRQEPRSPPSTCFPILASGRSSWSWEWPTIPQVFVKGELIGGADITEELYASGELGQKLDEELGEDLEQVVRSVELRSPAHVSSAVQHGSTVRAQVAVGARSTSVGTALSTCARISAAARSPSLCLDRVDERRGAPRRRRLAIPLSSRRCASSRRPTSGDPEAAPGFRVNDLGSASPPATRS